MTKKRKFPRRYGSTMNKFRERWVKLLPFVSYGPFRVEFHRCVGYF